MSELGEGDLTLFLKAECIKTPNGIFFTQRAYALVSETPTVKEIVETLANVVGHPVRYVPITDEQNFRSRGAEVPVTDTIRSVTGQSPQTLEEFFRARCPIN